MEVLVECREILKLGGITDLFALSVWLRASFILSKRLKLIFRIMAHSDKREEWRALVREKRRKRHEENYWK